MLINNVKLMSSKIDKMSDQTVDFKGHMSC